MRRRMYMNLEQDHYFLDINFITMSKPYEIHVAWLQCNGYEDSTAAMQLPQLII